MTGGQSADYVIGGHKLYWETLGRIRGCQKHTGKVEWLSGDVFCAYYVRFDGPDYKKEAGEIAEKMISGELPDRLILTPGAAPPDINIRDFFPEDKGFAAGTDCGMAKELNGCDETIDHPKNLNLFRVNETERLKTAGAIFNSAFEYDIFTFGHYLDLYNDPQARFYVAEYDGIPSGACMSVAPLPREAGCDFVEIAWVGTLAGYRKKGIAGYLVRMAERDAALNGKKVSALTAIPAGVNAYGRIGYKKCCEFTVICYNQG
jgi:GNAT superfamily N-acetyltransferase